ncbi:hypothetical protein LSH36_70g05008 [Paralvinella palmiformis]|uniref:Enoyl-CoA hydratase domain-containing protein 3, mitochondrial n=1 Tax=Paralvinella palmiformis TaxID=53620 RepID=A0AAD9K3F1_9ANNE|nr:hypothetical protein LSH36_70g05008 [Paralvinella palmiformis]
MPETLTPVISRCSIHTSLHCNQGNDGDRLTVCQQNEGIRKITLNNPKKRNALSLAMLTNLEQDLEDVTSDLRVIIIAAEGSVFSAGHDLKEMTSDKGIKYHKEIFKKCTDVMTLIKSSVIVYIKGLLIVYIKGLLIVYIKGLLIVYIKGLLIVYIKGFATAAGCQLVASCDIAIAAESSRFATPGVSVGIFCTTPGVALARAVPRKVALEMLFSGHPISAQDALLHGLVSRIVPDDKLEEECYHYVIEAVDVIIENLRFIDCQEGIKAFIEKRKPKWTHSNKKAH